MDPLSLEEEEIILIRRLRRRKWQVFLDHLRDDLERVSRPRVFRPEGPMNLQDLPGDIWAELFRFTEEQIDVLVVALELPSTFHGRNRCTQDAKTALCMLLARFAYPKRYVDLAVTFGWAPERISHITNAVIRFIYYRWRHILFWDESRLTPAVLKHFAGKIEAKGAPTMGIIWGFIDGTVRPLCRPSVFQRGVYNGHHRVHAQKFHGVNTPDGLIVHLFGPVEGRRHDRHIYAESRLDDVLNKHSWGPNSERLAIYGDPAYGLSPWIISPYEGNSVTADQRHFNEEMSRVRETIEWAWADVIRDFAYLDYKKNLRTLLQPVGLMYAVGILLTNAASCIRGTNETAQYFKCNPPSIYEYLQGEAWAEDVDVGLDLEHAAVDEFVVDDED